MAKCKYCGEEIIWMKTKNGKNIPVDPDSIQGDISVEVYDKKLMKCHFDSCGKKRHEEARTNDEPEY